MVNLKTGRQADVAQAVAGAVDLQLLCTVETVTVEQAVTGSPIASSLGKTEGIMIIDDEAVEKSAAVDNVGDFDTQFHALRQPVSAAQGHSGRLSIEQDLFPGV